MATSNFGHIGPKTLDLPVWKKSRFFDSRQTFFQKKKLPIESVCPKMSSETLYSCIVIHYSTDFGLIFMLILRTMEYGFWSNFHSSSIDYDFCSNFNPNTIDFGLIFILILCSINFGLMFIPILCTMVYTL